MQNSLGDGLAVRRSLRVRREDVRRRPPVPQRSPLPAVFRRAERHRHDEHGDERGALGSILPDLFGPLRWDAHLRGHRVYAVHGGDPVDSVSMVVVACYQVRARRTPFAGELGSVATSNAPSTVGEDFGWAPARWMSKNLWVIPR